MFEKLIKEAYKLSQAGNLIGILYNSGRSIGFSNITDIDKELELKYDMLYLKSIPTDTEIEIYESELKDFKVKNSEEVLYVLTKKGETRLIYWGNIHQNSKENNYGS